MLFVETPIFTKRIRVVLDDEQYRVLQLALIESPELGKVVPSSGGIRKLRLAGSGRGKRGGARVLYRWLPEQHRILMLFVFLKNEMADLTQKQLRALRHLVEDELR